MKKLLLFLILLSGLSFWNVKAETAKFYEGEYIPNTYISRVNLNNRKTYYAQARVYRKQGTDEYAYCIEPFTSLDSNAYYESTNTPTNLSPEQIDRITKIAHFGYGYGNHQEIKWYAVTQIMIWQEAYTIGNYYFTDTLNGRMINPYNVEITEINNLIENYNKSPSFSGKTIELVEDSYAYVEDNNQVLDSYQLQTRGVQKQGNRIILDHLQEGEYEFRLTKEENVYHKPSIFYVSNDSQNLIQTGDVPGKEALLRVNVIQTSLELSKIDKDTESTIPSGEASLDGAVYELYDENKELVGELTIEENYAVIKNLPFGTFTLKEKVAGPGYQLDMNTYEVVISNENPNILLTVENEVIKNQIVIHKVYGEDEFQNEEGIEFQITNQEKDLVESIKTDEEGYARVTLPYGTYTVTQINSTDGYQKIEPFTITVTDLQEEDVVYELKDLKIPVPDTHLDKEPTPFLQILILFLCFTNNIFSY